MKINDTQNLCKMWKYLHKYSAKTLSDRGDIDMLVQ